MTTLLRPLLALAAACALSTPMAWAQDRQSRQHDDRQPHSRPEQRAAPGHQARRDHDARRDHRAQRDHEDRRGPQARHAGRPDQYARPGSHDYRPGRPHVVRPPAYRPPAPHAHRGAGPNHNWYRGARLPAAYRTHHYVVQDWRGHHLSAPPRGYYWVQNGADYLLIAIASGVIAQIILSN